jgi:hypothetical protein
MCVVCFEHVKSNAWQSDKLTCETQIRQSHSDAMESHSTGPLPRKTRITWSALAIHIKYYKPQQSRRKHGFNTIRN